jgi:hypothetical protein
MIRRKGLNRGLALPHRRDPADRRAGRDLPERRILWAGSRESGDEKEQSGSGRVIRRGVLDRSCESLTDAIAGNLQAIGNSGLRHATAAQHADASGLRHCEQINRCDQQQQGQEAPEEKGGESHDFRKRSGCDWELRLPIFYPYR